MLASPADPAGSTENRQARLSATRSDIHRARPDLTDESPELRAAVLLLLAGEIGFNVDRLVMRTRYPREFVARCTRRLVDNGVWTAGSLRADRSSTPVDAPSFWWDVDVALGRRLRRISESGAPEWMVAGGWAKDFEYARSAAGRDSSPNEYRLIPRHDPEPTAAPAVEEEAAEVAAPARSAGRVEEARRTAALGSDAPHAVQWLGSPAPAAPSREQAAARSTGSMLGAWAGAGWLG